MEKDNLSFSKPMELLKTAEIVKAISEYEKKENNCRPVKILFLRDFTIEPVIPYLKYICYEKDIRCEISIGNYNVIGKETTGSGGLLDTIKPDIIIICIRPDRFLNRLSAKNLVPQHESISHLKDEIIGYVGSIIRQIRDRSQAVILLHNFQVPPYDSLGILASQIHESDRSFVLDLNRSLIELVSNYRGMFIVDIDNLQRILGYENFIDNRNCYLSQLPYSQRALRLLACEYLRYIRAIRGMVKKCLVLDCDNTLWGGIIGEDGINNIHIGHTYPGSMFLEFQQSVLELHNRGVLLAICSKNNETDVMEVFLQHPDMVLKPEHFLSMKINWTDKITNIREIARELNIGTESIVMIDDNPVETERIQQMLPEVEVIRFGHPNGCLYRDIINRTGLFDTLAISDEDRHRNELYSGDRKRSALQNVCKTPEEFLTGLEMEVYIKPSDAHSIPRIAQLTQKTNQFNLTTKRYTESQIEEYSKANDWCVRSLELLDRFGSNGIVGVVILKFVEDTAVIDTFLLSCRVIGRTVEDVLLMDCIETAKSRNCTTLIGEYIPTKKNIPVQTFYSDHGFAVIGSSGPSIQYQLGIQGWREEYPSHYKTIHRE